jgi:hypothetical protein
MPGPKYDIVAARRTSARLRRALYAETADRLAPEVVAKLVHHHVGLVQG